MNFFSRSPNSLRFFWHNTPNQLAGLLARQEDQRRAEIWPEGSNKATSELEVKTRTWTWLGQTGGILPWLLEKGLTHSRGFWWPLGGRCTCMVTRACPQKPQSQSAGYWWAHASGRPAGYPGSGCSADHPSWSKTSPSSNRCPQGSPPPAGLGRRNSSNHLEGRRMLVFLLFSL